MELRAFTASDSLEALTALLHRAYADHLAAGLRFFAAYQSVEDTANRIGRGECWVALDGGRMVGTVTIEGPNTSPPTSFVTHQMPADAGAFSQLAVDPSVRGSGLGAQLLELAERRLRELGARQMVIDTAERATALLAWYQRHGYQVVGRWRWEVTNFESVLLQKSLVTTPGTEAPKKPTGSSSFQ